MLIKELLCNIDRAALSHGPSGIIRSLLGDPERALSRIALSLTPIRIPKFALKRAVRFW